MKFNSPHGSNDATLTEKENAIKAVEKKSPGLLDRARWVPVVVGDGRYVVAFIGWENANLHHLGNVGVLV